MDTRTLVTEAFLRVSSLVQAACDGLGNGPDTLGIGGLRPRYTLSRQNPTRRDKLD